MANTLTVTFIIWIAVATVATTEAASTTEPPVTTADESTQSMTTKSPTSALTPEATTASTSTKPPTTGSTTDAPTSTKPPTTGSTTDAPTSTKPPTTGSTTDAPTSTKPPTSESTTDAPTSTKPPTSESTTDAPTASTSTKPLTSGSTTDAPTASTSTKPLTSGSTTDAPTSTKPPTSGSTTDAPTASTSTKPPTSGSTTDAPTASTSTKPLTSGPTTDTIPGSTPTKPPTPTPSSTATTQTETPPTKGPSLSPSTASFSTNAPTTATTEPPSACASNPCLSGSTCEERANRTYLCLCLAGEFYYENRGCEKSKVFPGLLVLKRLYDDKMADKTSQIFNETAKMITDEIDKQFSGAKNGYVRCLVLELREKNPATLRSTTNSVEASIEIIYEATSAVSEAAVTETMEKVACDACPLAESFQVKDACNPTVCDETSSNCNHTNGLLTCECNVGYITTNYTGQLCLACPAGKKAENGECVPCGFGRTGFNCEDETMLIIVIVCSILGFLMIVGLIAQPLVLKKSKKGSKSKEEDLWKSNQFPSSVKPPPPYSSNGFSTWIKEPANSPVNSGFPRIPRANTSSNWGSKTNLEMTPSNSRQNLVSSGRNSRFNNDQDDMFSFSESQPNEQVQSRSSTYSPYQATNPYAQIRGQTNPYFR